MLPVMLFGAEQGNHPCAENKCYASFGFGFNDFGFGSITTEPAGATYFVLLPSSTDKVLLPSSTDKMKLPGH
jgi:hypothetical protein